MPNELPYISALLPSRNGERYLGRLVPNILLMLGEHDELLVVNDGSTDNSAHILSDLSIKDSRLRILDTKGIGLVASLNLGISTAKNSWIARFDVDDEYPLNRIKLQRKLIANEVVAIFSDYSFMSNSGIWLGSIPSAITSNPTKLSLVSSQRTPHPAALMNRANVISVGGYHAEDFPVEDLGLWLRLAKKGIFLSVPGILLNYRLSNGSISSSNRKAQLTKKRKMISDFGAWNDLIESCIKEFTSTISYYLREKNSTARIILHIQDLNMASKLSGDGISTFKLLNLLPRLTLFKIPLVYMDIVTMAIARRVYRLSKNFLQKSFTNHTG